MYGSNTKTPFSVNDNVDHPISIYAASKKANELMAHAYSHLYGLPTTGLRLFTVYGPWGRPDMALFKFTKAMLANEKIPVFNFGKHRRDFTYIDDIVECIIRILDRPASSNIQSGDYIPDSISSLAPWRIYNIGNNKTESLQDFIATIEIAMGKKAIKEMFPMQQGDVPQTWADISELEKLGYKSSTKINEGVELFVKWYKIYSLKK